MINSNPKNSQELFDIIGNDLRRKILKLLVLEPHYVSQLSKLLDKSQPAILKHMKVLEANGLVVRTKEHANSPTEKGPDRHFFSINKSFTIMYSLSPHNVRERVFLTDINEEEEPKRPEKLESSESEESVTEKVSRINDEINKINHEMNDLEQKYIKLEKQKNKLLNLTNVIIDENDVLKDDYLARLLLRKHVCESQTCVQEISNLLSKKEVEIQNTLKLLHEEKYLF